MPAAVLALLLLASPAMAAQCGDWLLAPPGESCDIHCGGSGASGLSGKLCDEKYSWDHNNEVSTNTGINTVMTDQGFPCSGGYITNQGSAGQTPAYDTATQKCIVSDPSRAQNTFDCTTTPSAGIRRLCFCYIENCVHLKIGDFPMQGCRWHPERKKTCRG
uniref:Secreted protein n=1 Tax=Lotharella globosa TaxID=91324 RepID=A0A6V3TEP5_9EUKA|mmetsp:Transcript_19098/g.38616  ORF Transcript_19098/g.38616 Transcript_19098/m.38616 type:complete len:161 (+) Transcript_19098:50-532(+)